MDIRWISLLAVALCVAAVPMAPAKAVTLHVPYEGTAPLAYQGAQDCDTALALGIVCLDLPNSAREVAFLAADASGLAVGGSFWLHDAQGNALDGGHAYCAGGEARLPSEATLLVVRIETLNGPLSCLEENVDASGLGTKGVVSFNIR